VVDLNVVGAIEAFHALGIDFAAVVLERTTIADAVRGGQPAILEMVPGELQVRSAVDADADASSASGAANVVDGI
jgi:hypothetical protein